MPFSGHLQDGVLVTTLTGRVTNEDLLAYYTEALNGAMLFPLRELVDGTAVTEFEITPDGYGDLMRLFATRGARWLLGGRVAMVATSAEVFGMFRMWELRRESLNYEVRVFTDASAAWAWLRT